MAIPLNKKLLTGTKFTGASDAKQPDTGISSVTCHVAFSSWGRAFHLRGEPPADKGERPVSPCWLRLQRSPLTQRMLQTMLLNHHHPAWPHRIVGSGQFLQLYGKKLPWQNVVAIALAQNLQVLNSKSLHSFYSKWFYISCRWFRSLHLAGVLVSEVPIKKMRGHHGESIPQMPNTAAFQIFQNNTRYPSGDPFWQSYFSVISSAVRFRSWSAWGPTKSMSSGNLAPLPTSPDNCELVSHHRSLISDDTLHGKSSSILRNPLTSQVSESSDAPTLASNYEYIMCHYVLLMTTVLSGSVATQSAGKLTSLRSCCTGVPEPTEWLLACWSWRINEEPGRNHEHEAASSSQRLRRHFVRIVYWSFVTSMTFLIVLNH